MKETILLLLSVFGYLSTAFAQMLPDSTVQVVGYWSVGDKLQYEYECLDYKINGNDTTLTKSSYEVIELEVVAHEEDKGYRFKATYLVEDYSDPVVRILSNISAKYLGEPVYFFETDNLGAFSRALPVEGVDEIPEAMLQEVMDSLAKAKPETVIAREPILALLRHIYTPELMTQSIVTDFSPLFFFHGVKYKLDTDYSYEDETPALIGNQKIKMDATFWADSEDTDDYSAVLYLYKEANEEQLKPFITTFIVEMLKPMFPDENTEEAKTAMDEVFSQAKMEMKDTMWEEVHLSTGWPLNMGFTRTLNFKVGKDESGGIIQRNTFKVILDND